jgi:TolA-binding protein
LGLQEALTSSGNVEEFNEYLAKYKTANPEGSSTEKIEFETAKSLYFSQKYDKAKTGLAAFVTSYPQSSFVVEARFYLAECQYRAGEKAASLESHKVLVQEGKGSFFNRSLARVAELSIAENKPAEAVIYYKQLLGVAKNKKEQFVAMAGLMDAFYLQQEYDSTSVYANSILDREGIPPDIENKAALYKGKLEMAKGNFEAATDQFVTTLNGAKDVNGAEAQYLLAEILHKQGKYRESLEKCFELNKTFAAYTLWYDKSFLLIADNYIALKEDYQAVYTLEKIIDKSPNTATVEAARAKLLKLKGQ